MRSFQKGHWQGVRRVAWWCHAQGVQRGQRPFWKEPGGSGLFGRIAALRIGVKTSSLDPDSRLALHPKQGKLAFTPIYEMSSTILRMLVLSCAGLAMTSAQAGPQDLLRMSEQLDRVDKGDFDEAISKASQCIRVRDYTCAETQLKNARKFSTDSKSKTSLKRTEDELLAERAREKEEQRLAAQRQRELEKQEAQLRQAEQRARDAERQAQAEAEERENLNNRIAAAGSAYSQTIRAQANSRAAEQARNQQFAQQQAEAARNVANEQKRQAQDRAQLDSQRQQQQRQADAQRIQLAQAQQDNQQRAQAQAAAAAARSAPVSQPVRDIAPAAATAAPQKKSNSINTGREAMRCVSVSREKEDLGFTNTCNIQIFVVWCGNLKYSKKQCGDGPAGNSFYTHSVNVGPGDKQYARGIGDYHYAACEGGIAFGKDEIQDRPDGTFTCVPK